MEKQELATYTDLDGYNIPQEDDPEAFNGTIRSLVNRYVQPSSHLGCDFIFGDDTYDPVLTAMRCKNFLMEIVAWGKEFNLTNKQCIELLEQRTRNRAREIVSTIKHKDPHCTLTTIIWALEQQFMRLSTDGDIGSEGDLPDIVTTHQPSPYAITTPQDLH